MDILILSLAFLLLNACSSHERDNPTDPANMENIEPSSSSISSSDAYSSSYDKSSSSSESIYTITYNAGIGVTDVTVPDSQTKIYNVTLMLDNYEPTRTNYTFVSWNTMANGTGTAYVPGGSYIINASVTLYAQWNQTDIIYGPDVDYEGEIYETVVIGAQTWFSRNLNYAKAGSKCGDGNTLSDEYADACYYYGRLYNWATAMALPASCNSNSCEEQIDPNKHKGICPIGWHIPSKAEWDTLVIFVQKNNDCNNCDAKHLKSADYWMEQDGKYSLDTYGFAALPGGYGSSNKYFGNVGEGEMGGWWSVSANASSADYRYINSNEDGSHWGRNNKSNLYSVRCIKD